MADILEQVSKFRLMNVPVGKGVNYFLGFAVNDALFVAGRELMKKITGDEAGEQIITNLPILNVAIAIVSELDVVRAYIGDKLADLIAGTAISVALYRGFRLGSYINQYLGTGEFSPYEFGEIKDFGQLEVSEEYPELEQPVMPQLPSTEEISGTEEEEEVSPEEIELSRYALITGKGL